MQDKQLMRWRSTSPVHRSWRLEPQAEGETQLVERAPATGNDRAFTADAFWQLVDPAE